MYSLLNDAQDYILSDAQDCLLSDAHVVSIS
jgi:hypothetical protein